MSYRERRAEEKRAQLLKEEEAKSKKIESEANLISDNQEIQSDKIGEFAERILLASSFQFPQRNELFTPGRMAFLFSLDIHDKYQLPDPYTIKNVSSVLRSAKDTKNLIVY